MKNINLMSLEELKVYEALLDEKIMIKHLKSLEK